MYPGLNPLISYLSSLSERANLADLKSYLAATSVTRSDISPSCLFGEKTYKRNLVSYSDWYELLVMCWRPGQRSPIHDHGVSVCGVKIIEGTLTENRYTETCPGRVVQSAQTSYKADDLCVRIDSDIHEMVNTGSSDLITLHLYSPVLKMNIYELDTAHTAI